MAESATKAFGRYLKTLRERRGLSLDEVASLSQTFPEKINKGYLSRCENGHQKLAFSKVIALSRIFEVPADVLVERMELDLELDRVGGPETEGMSYAELTDAGKKALDEGFFLNAYGYLRDAIQRASLDPLKPSFRDMAEQNAIAQMNCGTAARSMGRHCFALHEFLHLESTGAFEKKTYPLILERISGCYRSLKDYAAAEKYAESAIEKAEAYGDQKLMGYFYANRARIASDTSNIALAIAFHHKAHKAYKRADHLAECVHALNNISQCYFDLKRFRASRRAAEAAKNIARDNNLKRSLGLSHVLLGELDEAENHKMTASQHWKQAAAIGKRINDRELRFKAEFYLFRRAIEDGNSAVARAIKRRLIKLTPLIPADTQELVVFKSLASDKTITVEPRF